MHRKQTGQLVLVLQRQTEQLVLVHQRQIGQPEERQRQTTMLLLARRMPNCQQVPPGRMVLLLPLHRKD